MYTNSKTAADTRFIWYTWALILMYTSCIPCIPTGAAALILVTITQELGAWGTPLWKNGLCVWKVPPAVALIVARSGKGGGGSARRPDRHRSRSKAAQLSILQPDSPFAGLLRKTRSELLPFLACYAAFTLWQIAFLACKLFAGFDGLSLFYQ